MKRAVAEVFQPPAAPEASLGIIRTCNSSGRLGVCSLVTGGNLYVADSISQTFAREALGMKNKIIAFSSVTLLVLALGVITQAQALNAMGKSA